jgi:hypothetical protein
VGDAEELPFGTIMQTYVRFTPMNVPLGSSDQVNTDQFVKLVVTSVDEDAAEVARMMDSLLLGDSRDHNLVVRTPVIT